MKENFHFSAATKISLLCSVAYLWLFVSCSTGTSSGGNTTDAETVADVVPVSFSAETVYSGSHSQLVSFSGPTKTIELSGLTGQSVFLVKLNKSATIASGSGTGSVASSSLGGTSLSLSSRSVYSSSSRSACSVSQARSGRYVSGVFGGYTRYDYEPARESNASLSSGSRSVSSVSASAASLTRSNSYTSGTSKNFWVQNNSGSWIQISATVKAIGTYCYVWVADANYNASSTSSTDNQLTTTQASDIATNFDAIYPVETNLLGYEYGGNGVVPVGGVDTDSRIGILVYDIDYDYTANQSSGVFGYFWSKDETSDSHSNSAEMFYIDSHFTDCYPSGIYSTLIHEYQHMINYNQKNIAHPTNDAPSTWFNEMLSLLAEDTIGPKLSSIIPSNALPAASRIPLFLGTYDYRGLRDWSYGDDTLISYAGAYAWGAYLARNYGGAELLKAMETNATVDETSITNAIQSVNSGSTDTFDTAFEYYGEALLFSGTYIDSSYSALKSFDRTVTKTVGSYTYTNYAFDIWQMDNYFQGSYGIDANYQGPLVWNLSQYDLPAYGLTLQSSSVWQKVTGDLSITLNKPSDTDVELYVMVR